MPRSLQMKPKSLFLLTFLVLACYLGTTAQPGCMTMSFNPFNNYSYKDVDFVIYGSVIGYEDLKDWVKFNGGNTYFSISRTKIKIQVSEVLKGKLNEKQIEVYVGNDCTLDQVGGKRIFTIKRSYAGETPVFVSSDRVSNSLNNFSQEGLGELLKKVKSDLRTNNDHNLYGVVVEKFADSFSYTASDEAKLKLGYHPKEFKPLAGITIEARRKTDSKVVRTKTDKDGKFTFKDLATGEYQVYPLLPNIYKMTGFNLDTEDEHGKVSIYFPVRDGFSNPRKVFELETFGNLKGKIENVFPGFEKADLEIWKLVNNNGKTEYQLFDRAYLSGKLDRFKKSESSLELDFPDFPTGKYILNFSSPKATIYYPGITDKAKAKVFEVKKGETTDVSFKIS